MRHPFRRFWRVVTQPQTMLELVVCCITAAAAFLALTEMAVRAL